ncbi:MAG: TolC family type I secretion outer membrane [Gallionellaceae bacterium]|nr:MAG: TolC family type I secretion outer membrane [Gallionellaceae bacterium]
MSRRIAAVAVQTALISALWGANAFAADLVEVLQAAKGHDPEYLAAKSEQSAGGARRSMGNSLLKPSVNFVAGAGVVNENSSTAGAQFSAPNIGSFNNANFNTSVNFGARTRVALQASQPLYDREISVQRDQLQLSADVSDMGMASADQALIFRVASGYFEAVKTRAIINLLVQQQNAVSSTYSEISKRQHLGDASKIDLQLTAEKVEATKAKLLNAQLAYNNDLLMLRELTGQNIKVNSLDVNFSADGVLTGSAAEWLAKAKQNNQQLKLLALLEQVKKSEIEKYGSSLSPKVNLIAQLQRDQVNGSGDYGTASNTTSSGSLGVQVSVPLTDGYRSAKKDEAFYLAEKAKLEYEQASLRIEKEINSIWFALTTGRERIESLSRIVSLSKDRLEATEKNHRQGSRTTMELLGAQSDYIASKLVLLEAQVNLIVNRVRLSSMAGEISEQDLLLANRFLSKN